jgi:hypothetical protein
VFLLQRKKFKKRKHDVTADAIAPSSVKFRELFENQTEVQWLFSIDCNLYFRYYESEDCRLKEKHFVKNLLGGNYEL